MHDVRHDPINDELWAANPFARALMVYDGGADGNTPPKRVIQGYRTMLGDPSRYAGGPDRLDVDAVNDEVLLADGTRVLVYSRTANGNVAPIRVITGDRTLMNDEGTLAVDPVHNVIAVAQDIVRVGETKRSHILFFERTANGNALPRNVIWGPKTQITRINQLQMYPPKGWLVAAQPGYMDEHTPEGVFIGVWHINDDGNVPPRYKITGSATTPMLKPRGVALNPNHKEIIVADMRRNAILTFSFPEMF